MDGGRGDRDPSHIGHGRPMTRGSWPYLPAQCPACFYLQAELPPFTDDSGYEILGFCRHPRIGMELFRPKKLGISTGERCPLFVRQITSARDA
jgi:hypothetical protein